MDSKLQALEAQSNEVIGTTQEPVDDANAAGNWMIFKRRCAFLDATPVLGVRQNIDAKRHYALAYLGERAQLRGGSFRAAKPTVFTEAVVTSLNKRNTAARYARYPWLAQMMALIAALDEAQYNVVNQEGNVLAFPDNFSGRTSNPQIG
ncbi:MAG: hypothetical protein NVSMB6_19270 [Burkholderiaceae bacterium]